MGKIRVEELAAQMGIGSKEVLFLLQSIGVDVKSPQAALDESTVLAILQGKTHAPKQLIVRDTEAGAARPQKSALTPHQDRRQAARSHRGCHPRPSRRPRSRLRERPAAETKATAEPRTKPAEPARTAVVPVRAGGRRRPKPRPSQDRPSAAAASRPAVRSAAPAGQCRRGPRPPRRPPRAWARRPARRGSARAGLPRPFIIRHPADQAPSRGRRSPAARPPGAPGGRPARPARALRPAAASRRRPRRSAAARPSARRTTRKRQEAPPASAAPARRSRSPTRSTCASSWAPTRKTRTRTSRCR